MKRNDSDMHDVLLPNSGSDDGILPVTTTSSAGAATPACMESASTSVTASGYDSEEEGSTSTGGGGGWFGTGGAVFSDFRTLAVSLRETAGGVASVVKTCAINVAAEIALLEDEEGFGPAAATGEEQLHLPWEIKNEETGEYQEDPVLKHKIFQLSKEERNFFEPYSSKRSSKGNEESDDDSGDFVLDDARVRIIRQLLKLDPPLSAMHARISGRKDVREVTFWRNYFFACDEAREHHLNCLEVDEKLEVLSQKSFPSQRSLNSLVPDDDDDADDLSEEEDDDASKDKLESSPNSPSANDDSSFVCLSAGKSSPPGSVKSFKSSRSAGSMVLVEPPRQNSFLEYLSSSLKK